MLWIPSHISLGHQLPVPGTLCLKFYLSDRARTAQAEADEHAVRWIHTSTPNSSSPGAEGARGLTCKILPLGITLRCLSSPVFLSALVGVSISRAQWHSGEWYKLCFWPSLWCCYFGDITLPTKVCLVKAIYGFSSGHVWMWELDYKESWALEELMPLNCGLREDSWESLGLQGDPTSPF